MSVCAKCDYFSFRRCRKREGRRAREIERGRLGRNEAGKWLSEGISKRACSLEIERVRYGEKWGRERENIAKREDTITGCFLIHGWHAQGSLFF